jgi:hypothetical protein
MCKRYREFHYYSAISVMKSPNKETVVNGRFVALTAIIVKGHVDWYITWEKKKRKYSYVTQKIPAIIQS